jgi:hypothetical protein
VHTRISYLHKELAGRSLHIFEHPAVNDICTLNCWEKKRSDQNYTKTAAAIPVPAFIFNMLYYKIVWAEPKTNENFYCTSPLPSPFIPSPSSPPYISPFLCIGGPGV